MRGFADRREAGRRLAEHLDGFRARGDVVVVGLPRGGVPVAAEVARQLGVPLDAIIVRKLGVPARPEVAMGAIGEHGIRVLDDDVVRRARVTPAEIAAVERREMAELERRSATYRRGRPPTSLSGKVVIVVDDGVATGSTARAACQVARGAGASFIALAVPVAPSDWTRRLGDVADLYVAAETHRNFGAVGRFYREFSATTDDEVIDCLDHGWRSPAPSPQEKGPELGT